MMVYFVSFMFTFVGVLLLVAGFAEEGPRIMKTSRAKLLVGGMGLVLLACSILAFTGLPNLWN